MGHKYTITYKIGTKVVHEIYAGNIFEAIWLLLTYIPKVDYDWFSLDIRP